jgi:hypothetical protein
VSRLIDAYVNRIISPTLQQHRRLPVPGLKRRNLVRSTIQTIVMMMTSVTLTRKWIRTSTTERAKTQRPTTFVSNRNRIKRRPQRHEDPYQITSQTTKNVPFPLPFDLYRTLSSSKKHLIPNPLKYNIRLFCLLQDFTTNIRVPKRYTDLHSHNTHHSPLNICP